MEKNVKPPSSKKHGQIGSSNSVSRSEYSKDTNILKITTKKTLVSNSLVKLSHLIHLPLQSPELQWHLTGDAKVTSKGAHDSNVQRTIYSLFIARVLKKRSTEIQTSFYKKGLLHILEMMIQSETQPKLNAHFLSAPAWSWLFNCLWCSTGRADTNRWHLRHFQHHGMIPWDIQFPPHQHSEHHQDDPQPLKLLFSMFLTSD